MAYKSDSFVSKHFHLSIYLSKDFASYQKRFTIFTCAMPSYVRKSHLLPDQLLGEHTGDMAAIFTFLIQCDNLRKCIMLLEVWWLDMFWWSTHVLLFAKHESTHPSLFMSTLLIQTSIIQAVNDRQLLGHG